eukprot:s4464_g4.t1
MPTEVSDLQPHEPFGRHLQPGAGCHFSLRGTQALANERYRWWDDGFRPEGVTFRITFTAAGVTQYQRDEVLRVVNREDGWFRFSGVVRIGAQWSTVTRQENFLFCSVLGATASKMYSSAEFGLRKSHLRTCVHLVWVDLSVLPWHTCAGPQLKE